MIRSGPTEPHLERSSRDTNGIQSVDIAMRVLRVMLDAGEPLSLKEYSARSRMAPSKLHRYLHSLVESGLLTQARRAGHYELGPFALETGLAALQRMEVLNQSADRLGEFASESGLSACLTVWSPIGPTIIRWQKGRRSVNVAFGVGDVLPLLVSATGHVFLAFLPREDTRAVIEKEQEELRLQNKTAGQLDEIIATVRTQQYACSRGFFIAGILGIAAPIFNLQNEIAAVVTVVARTIDDEAAETALINQLVGFARTCSVRWPESK